jgi:3-hydroxybutyryl-CoA dehydrogenase
MADKNPIRVGVIGAGLMGHAIAFNFASHGFSVDVVDPSPDALRTLPERLASCAAGTGLPFTDVRSMTDVPRPGEWDVGFVVEAVAEDRAIKSRVLQAAGDAAPEAILATNTSVIAVSDIAKGTSHPERVIGTHWWNPPHLIDIVEVVAGIDTDPAVVERTHAWLERVGKTPVRVNRDIPGFIGNRLQFAMWREAINLVEQGVCTAADVDTVARGTFGRRLPAMGPLENADYIGIDLTAQILAYVIPSLANATTPPALVQELLDQGRTGARSGRGFIDWPAGSVEMARTRLEQQLLGDGPASRV